MGGQRRPNIICCNASIILSSPLVEDAAFAVIGIAGTKIEAYSISYLKCFVCEN